MTEKFSQYDQYNSMAQQNGQFQQQEENLYEDEINASISRKVQFDQAFLNKFIHEIEDLIHETEEFRFIGNPYRIAVSKFATDAEGELLKNINQQRKEAIYRDISRIFDKEPEGGAFKAKIRKIMNIRLEEIRRQIKDNKWNVLIHLFQSLLVLNKGNRDVLDLLAYKELPNDFRQIVWRFCLENDEESEEYAKKMRENRLLTISKFDLQIIKDCEGFVSQMMAIDEFDGSMMFAMKTVLSYYEKKNDRILSDYLYMLVIPLVYTFGTNKHMHKIPVDLVGYFFNLVKVVKFFDPLVDLLIKHNEAYDAEMTDLIMNTLVIVDPTICEKIGDVLTLENPQSRTLLVLVVKRFIHSLGFAFLPIRITQFVWDQLLMKIVKNRLEIFVVMSCMFLCLKDKLLLAKDWDEMVDIIYIEGQKIDYDLFVDQYRILFQDSRFYLSQYNVNPDLVNRERGEGGIGKNPLQQLLDQQSKKDKKTLRKKWEEGENIDQAGDLYDEDEEDDQEDDILNSTHRNNQMQDMQIDDIMKDMKQQQQPYQKMGMVPVLDQDQMQSGDEDEEEEEEDDFDPLQGA